MEWSVVGRVSAASGRKGNATRERQRGGRPAADFSRTLAGVAAAARLNGGDGFAEPPKKAGGADAALNLWRFVAQVNVRLSDWVAGQQLPLT